MIGFRAPGYPMATYDAVTGRWDFPAADSLSEGDWGTLRIEAGAVWNTTGTYATLTTPGTDITTVNGVPTLIDSLLLGEPYGELTGQITLPGVSPLDDLSAIGCGPGSNVDIYRVLPTALATAAGVDEVPYWHGFIGPRTVTDGPGITTAWSLQLLGALYGEALLRQQQPLMLDTSNDVGTWCGRALDYVLYSRPFSPMTRFTYESAETGIEVRYRGSRGQSTIDYLDELLAIAQDDSAQWTISRAYQDLGDPVAMTAPRPRHYYLRAKSADMATAVQQNTVFLGGYGVSVSLSDDITQTPNAVYGEGVHPVDSSELSGSRWRNAQYPMLSGTAPAYPDRVTGTTYPIIAGDDDADFTADVVTQVSAQLRLGGWPDVQITGIFDQAVGDAITHWKQEYGWSNTTPRINSDAEWDALFSAGTTTTDLSSAWFKPLYVDPPASKYLYTPAGGIAGDNSLYDPNLLRIETTIAYGENVKKSSARANAKRTVGTGDIPVIGSITITTDPTDEFGDGRSRFDIREGGWVQLNNFPGGSATQFYIASAQHSIETGQTLLNVSTRPFDLLDLATRIDRDRTARTDPAKSFYSQRTATVRPFRSAVGWDAESGAGRVPTFTATGGQWTIQKFTAGQYGQIGSLRVDTATATTFCLAVFGDSLTGTTLDGVIAAPLSEEPDGYGWWAHPSNAVQLENLSFIEAWGEFGNSGGYYPGVEGKTGAAGAITGALEDAMPWTFASMEPPWLWLAIWTTDTTTVKARMRIVQDEG